MADERVKYHTGSTRKKKDNCPENKPIKIYWNGKRIFISFKKNIKRKNAYSITFISSKQLKKEYKKFHHAAFKTLLINGDKKKIWKAFRSLFKYVQAAGGVVKNKKGQLLVIYRNGRWDLPKGKMEKGESPALTALREVKEECGIKKLKIIKKLPNTYHIYLQNNVYFLKCTFWYEMLSSDRAIPKPQKEEGIEIAEWIPIRKIKQIKRKTYPSLNEILNYVLKK